MRPFLRGSITTELVAQFRQSFHRTSENTAHRYSGKGTRSPRGRNGARRFSGIPGRQYSHKFVSAANGGAATASTMSTRAERSWKPAPNGEVAAEADDERRVAQRSWK